MRLLLDTHAFAWWMIEPARLAPKAYNSISDPDNEVHVSAVSIWEMSIKHHVGRWPEIGATLTDLKRQMHETDFLELPITLAHGLEAGRLRGPHRDPFDRLLIAQARIDGLVIVTADRVFAAYGVPTLWAA